MRFVCRISFKKVDERALIFVKSDVIMNNKDAGHSDVGRFSQSSDAASAVTPTVSVVPPHSSELLEENDSFAKKRTNSGLHIDGSWVVPSDKAVVTFDAEFVMERPKIGEVKERRMDSEVEPPMIGEVKEMVEGDEQLRCQLCNKPTATASLTNPKTYMSMPCGHKYCLFCASVTNQARRCLLCLSAGSVPRSDLTPPCSAHGTSSNTAVFPDLPRTHTGITSQVPIEQSFSIWNPITPKSASTPRRLPKYMMSSLLESSNQCIGGTSPVSPHLAAGTGHFSLPPPLMSQTINWHTAPMAEIQTSFENSYSKCTMCAEENAVATARCIQCEETLCGECVVAHHRVRMTRDHTLVSVEPYKAITLPQVVGGSDCFKLDDLVEGETCNTHDAPLLCTCTTCGGVGLCHMCIPEHPRHPLVPHGDLRTAIVMLIAGSKHDQKNVEDAIETVRRMTERVEASVQSVMRELRSVIHIHISALEERKRDLLQRVDTIRQSKMSVLKAQGERLALRLTSLNDALKAAEAVAASGEGNEVHLRATFDSLMAVVREQNVYLVPNETDLLKFVPPDNSFITRLRNLGELDSGACARTTHVIGDGYKRAIRGRVSTVEVQTRDACGDVCLSTSSSLTASFNAPDGRPLQVHVNEREGGVYALSYYPVEEGSHILDIVVRGVSISGFPAIVHVRKGRNYASLARTGPVFSFGGEGSGDGQVCRPWGICCDNKGRILVADRSNNRIQIFDKDGKFLMKFGSAGVRSGQFDRPAGIAVNSMNEIVVADKDNHRIQVFNEKGEFLLKFGERGRTPGMFNYPWGVAVNAYNQIAVSDTRNHRVQIFSPQGQYLRKCGFDSSLYYKNLDSPRGVCFLPNGHLVITDFNNHRLAVVSSCGPSEMKCYGSEGEGDGYFCRPQGVTIDSEGHILVCDSRNNRVQVLNAEDMHCVATFGGSSANMTSVSKIGAAASGTGSSPPSSDVDTIALDRPTDICVSPEGTIYVVDFGSNCIRVY